MMMMMMMMTMMMMTMMIPFLQKPCTGIDDDKNLYVVYNQRGMKIGNTDW